MTDRSKNLGNESIFPSRYLDDSYVPERIVFVPGTTKRELLATVAMWGLCVNDGYLNKEALAKDAIKYADALLEELSK